jgi:hypothetical protein
MVEVLVFVDGIDAMTSKQLQVGRAGARCEPPLPPPEGGGVTGGPAGGGKATAAVPSLIPHPPPLQ